MFRPKPVTVEEFAKVKLQFNHKWKFLGEQGVGKDKRLKCRCESCNRDHWVIWKWIRAGRTRQCKFCAKKPDIKQFNKMLEDSGVKWRLSDISRNIKKDGVSQKRREYWATCLGCKSSKWIAWATIQQLKTPMCRSCSTRLRRTGKLSKMSDNDRDLYLRYRGLSWCKWSNKYNNEFKSFDDFKGWALLNGYRPGRRLTRKKKSGPYSPDNCYFVETKHESKYASNRAHNFVNVKSK